MEDSPVEECRQAFSQLDADPDAAREREADEFRALCKPFDTLGDSGFLPIEKFGSVMIEYVKMHGQEPGDEEAEAGALCEGLLEEMAAEEDGGHSAILNVDYLWVAEAMFGESDTPSTKPRKF